MSGLRLRGLTLDVATTDGPRRVIRGVDLDVEPGESVGLVGESGSGKSLLARSVLGLVPRGAVMGGSVEHDGRRVQEMSPAELRSYRARDVAMIFQDPRAHINPVRRIGDFMTEGLRARGISRSEARGRAVDLLAEVGMADGERRLAQYPHELSGGLLQRVMIATALASEPQLMIADEPTTALDVSTQNDVLELMCRLREERGMALILITHELEVAAAVCGRTAVMYAGELVEVQESRSVHARPLHPYTAGLVGARPSLERRTDRLVAIPGRPVSAFEAPGDACAFVARCHHERTVCHESHPALLEVSSGSTRCVRRQSEWADVPAAAGGEER